MDFSIIREVAISITRAVGISAVVVPIASMLHQNWLVSNDRKRLVHGLLLLILFLAPALFTAYAYANFTGYLTWPKAARESGYSLLLIFKLLLPASLALVLLRPRISAEAQFMLPKPTLRSHLLGAPGAKLLSGTLVFLLVFNEFEFASFFLVDAWTVKLFDAQVGGLLLSHSLRQVLIPFGVELILLIAALRLLHWRGQFPPCAHNKKSGSKVAIILLWAGVTVIIVIPTLLMIKDLGAGFDLLTEGFIITREWSASLLFSLLAACSSYLMCTTRRAWLPLAFPGLLGTLVLGLSLLALFQAPPASRFYDTMLPLTLGLALWVLPVGLFIRFALADRGRSAGAYLGESTRTPGKFRWTLVSRYYFVLFLVLFCLSWFDLTLSTLLAPSHFTPLPVRLYNFMHYGQSARLTAMVFVSLLTPVLLIGVTYPLARTWILRCGN